MKKRIIAALLGIITTQSGLVSAMKPVKIVKQNKSYVEDLLFANPIQLKKRVLEAIRKNQVNNITITLENKTLRKKLSPLKNVMMHLALKMGHAMIFSLILNTYPTTIQHINQEDLDACVINATLKNEYISIKKLLNNSPLRQKIEPLIKYLVRLAIEEEHIDLLPLIIKHFPDAQDYITQEDINTIVPYAIAHKKENILYEFFTKETILDYAFSKNNPDLISSLLKEKCAKNTKKYINYIPKSIEHFDYILKKVTKEKESFLKKTENSIIDLLKNMPLKDLLDTFASEPNAFEYIIRYVVRNITDQETLGKTLVFAAQKNHTCLVHTLLWRQPLILGESFLRQALTYTEKYSRIRPAIQDYLDEHYPSFFQKIDCVCQ